MLCTSNWELNVTKLWHCGNIFKWNFPICIGTIRNPPVHATGYKELKMWQTTSDACKIQTDEIYGMTYVCLIIVMSLALSTSGNLSLFRKKGFFTNTILTAWNKLALQIWYWQTWKLIFPSKKCLFGSYYLWICTFH